jgi:hypothetical protein
MIGGSDKVSDMYRVVSGVGEQLGDPWWQALVDEQPHAGERSG